MSVLDEIYDSTPARNAPPVNAAFAPGKRSYLDDLYDSVPARAPAKPKSGVGATVLDVADKLGSGLDFLNQRGIDTEQIFAPARKAAEQSNNMSPLQGGITKASAVGSGIAGFGDLIGNMAAYPLQQLAHIPADQRWHSDMQGAYNKLPGVSDVRGLAPEMFDQYASAAQIAAPLPARSAEILGAAAPFLGRFAPVAVDAAKAMQATGKARLLDAVLTQEVIGAGQAINEAAKQNRDVTPGELAIASALGAGGGALGEGLGIAASRLLGGHRAPLPVSSTHEAPVQPQNIDMNERLQQFFDNGIIDPNDPEFAGLLNGSHEAPMPEAPTPAPIQPAPLVPPRKKLVQDMAAVVQQEADARRKVLTGEISNDVHATPGPMDLVSSNKPSSAFHNALISLATAEPHEMLDAIQRANRSIPSGTPKALRKQLKGALEAAVNARLAQHEANEQAMLKQLDDHLKLQEKQQSLSYPNYLDFSQEPQPRFTRVSPEPQSLGYPNYLDFSQEAKPATYAGGNPRNYLDLSTQSPETTRNAKIVDSNGRHVLGRDVVEYSRPHSEIADPTVRRAVQELAISKVESAASEHEYDHAAQSIYARFGDGKNALKLGRHTIEPPSHRRELNYLGQQEKAKLRAQYADTVGTPAKDSFDATPDLDPSEYAINHEVPRSLEQANALLTLLQQRRSDAAKKLSNARGYLKSTAELMPDRGRSISHHVSLDVEGKPVTVKVNFKAGRQEYAFTYEKIATQARKSKDPSGESQRLYDEYKQNLIDSGATPEEAIVSADKLADDYHNYLNAVKRLESDPVFNRIAELPASVKAASGRISKKAIEEANTRAGSIVGRVINVRTLQGITTFSGLSLMSESSAHAADGSDDQKRNDATFRAGALLVATGVGLPITRKLLATKLGRSAIMYADGLDHAFHLDDLLGRQGMDRLGSKILKSTADAVHFGWGVHFDDQSAKAQALEELVTKAVSVQDAISAPPVGSAFAQMTLPQRQAVVGFYAAKKGLARIVAQSVAETRDRLANMQLAPRDRTRAEDSLAVLQNLALDLQGGRQVTGLGRQVAGIQANIMEGLFLLNPGHHLVNLSDSLIGGSARVGLRNMLQAWADMTDPAMRKLFHDANLFGSYKEDHANLSALGQHARRLIPGDFRSDDFNANRVALAAWHQYYDLNRAAMQKAGYADYRHFVADLLGNRVPGGVLRDGAWDHMIEANMRVLGMDPLRANPNAFKLALGPSASLALSFANQPVRSARLLSEMASKGQWDRIGVFMAATAALGGSAAIPATAQLAGQYLAPEETAALKKVLDGLSIPGVIANVYPEAGNLIPNASTKLDYDPLAPFLFGARGLALETVGGFGSNLLDAGQALRNGETDKAAAKAYQAGKAVLNMANKRGLPLGELLRVAEAAHAVATGKKTIYNYANFDLGKGIQQGEPYTVDLAKQPNGWAIPAVESLTGQTESTFRHRQAQAEQKFGNPQGARFFEDPYQARYKNWAQ